MAEVIPQLGQGEERGAASTGRRVLDQAGGNGLRTDPLAEMLPPPVIAARRAGRSRQLRLAVPFVRRLGGEAGRRREEDTFCSKTATRFSDF